MKKRYQKGRKVKDWELIKFLGGGGNGEVWACKNSNGETKAIKLLKSINEKTYDRFKDEVTILEQSSNIDGVIPIYEKYLPNYASHETPYFIMPLAETSEKLLNGKTIEEKVKAVIQVAETLLELHKRKIYHRDIKPANILFFNSRYSLADFGLVDYPNKKEVSLRNEEIGAKWTMAPEMRRNSHNANLQKADIYSLGKTLWIYLTENKKGFDGQYSTESIIHLKQFYPKNYTSPIDNLLISCTDNDPNKRPEIGDFIDTLNNWLELEDNFHEKNLQQWFEIQTKLFPASIPSRVIWENIEDIVKVLKIICSFDDLNHFFFPNGGGMDLNNVALSEEDGCIELDFSLISIVKPRRLIFESFDYSHEWNYFRLELDELNPSIIHKIRKGEEPYEKTHLKEAVTQVYPGYYKEYEFKDNVYHNPEAYNVNYHDLKHVSRWFRGSFVIFCKRSTYNLDHSTYDGRHNQMSTDEFRAYIQRNVNNSKSEYEKLSIFEKIFSKSPLKKSQIKDIDTLND